MYKTTINIDGMMCEMCENHINDVIRNNFTVKKVKASRRKKLVEIVSEEKLDEQKLAEVISATGYEPGEVSVAVK